jgi:drug/metabolite transporter (DMT)-like permease
LQRCHASRFTAPISGGFFGARVLSQGMSKPEAAARVDAAPSMPATSLLLGALAGGGAAFGWAAGLAGALHGIEAGLTPMDLALMRFVWLAPLLAYFVFREGFLRPFGLSWGKAIALTCFAGPPIALFSYFGFTAVPLGHGAVIQPSSASLGGLLLTALFLHEPLPKTRVIGALAIVLGLVIYAGEAVTTIGSSGIIGDLSFVVAGSCWAIFGLLLSRWRVDPLRAAAVVTVLGALLFVPVHAAVIGYGNFRAAGLEETIVQALVQGVLAGAGGIYLFTRAVALLGPGRAAVSPALVPGFTMLIGFLWLGVVPTAAQLAGFLVVTIGFALVLRR